MGEGQEGESFAVPLKIRVIGFTGRSFEKGSAGVPPAMFGVAPNIFRSRFRPAERLTVQPGRLRSPHGNGKVFISPDIAARCPYHSIPIGTAYSDGTEFCSFVNCQTKKISRLWRWQI
jgi:hypothetical protein